MTQERSDERTRADHEADATARWTPVGAVDDFPEGEHICLDAAGKPLVLFHIDGTFYAIANECPHAGLPIGEGERRGMVITCPYHGYTYHIRNGRNIDYPYDEPPARTYPVRVADGRVEVDLAPKRGEP